MKKYIVASEEILADDKLQAGEQVNKIAKYIKKHIDGAYKITFNPGMTADVYIKIYYQIPDEVVNLVKKYGQEMKDTGVKSMDIDVSLTSYQNKVRINVIRMDDNEKTLGHFVLKPEEIVNLNDVLGKIKDKVASFIEKEYQDYDFVF